MFLLCCCEDAFRRDFQLRFHQRFADIVPLRQQERPVLTLRPERDTHRGALERALAAAVEGDHTHRGRRADDQAALAKDARHRLSKRQREARLNSPVSGEEMVAPEPTPDQRAGRQQEIRLLQRALARLPLEKREVLLLSRVQDLKYNEVAEILGCDPGTVKVRVHRALKELRDIFRELTGEKHHEV